jgi:hypothetical protein
MDIDRRLHEAGHQWRQSQGPALPAPKLDTSLQKAPPRRWMTGLIPLAASAAVAAMVIGVVVLHNAPASHQVPYGSTSTSSPTSTPTSTPTASAPAQTSQPTDTTGPLTTTRKPAAKSLVVTAEIRTQLLQTGAALHGLPASAFTGLMSGQTYYAYDPATATYWAGAKLVPSSSSLRAQVSVQDNGSYILFRRPADKAWTAQDVGLAGIAGTKCTTSVPASVLTVWNWLARSCRPASMASIVSPSSVPTLGQMAGVFARGQGFGQVKPSEVFNGGDPTGLVTKIVWHSWGAPQSVGAGISTYVGSNQSVAQGTQQSATIVAFDLGTCNGKLMYRAVEWYFPQHGQIFDPNAYENICTGSYVGNR